MRRDVARTSNVDHGDACRARHCQDSGTLERFERGSPAWCNTRQARVAVPGTRESLQSTVANRWCSSSPADSGDYTQELRGRYASSHHVRHVSMATEST